MEYSKDLLLFSERMNDLMEEQELTANELSKRMDVPPSLICRWRKPDTDKFLSTIIKIADYFQCSLDYLSGRSDESIPYEFKDCPPFSERLSSVLKCNRITTYSLFKNTKIKSSHLARWKKGCEPKLTTLITIADFLNCSLDYLVGREK